MRIKNKYRANWNIEQLENKQRIKNGYRTNWNKDQLENKQRIKNGYRTNQLSIPFSFSISILGQVVVFTRT